MMRNRSATNVWDETLETALRHLLYVQCTIGTGTRLRYKTYVPCPLLLQYSYSGLVRVRLVRTLFGGWCVVLILRSRQSCVTSSIFRYLGDPLDIAVAGSANGRRREKILARW